MELPMSLDIDDDDVSWSELLPKSPTTTTTTTRPDTPPETRYNRVSRPPESLDEETRPPWSPTTTTTTRSRLSRSSKEEIRPIVMKRFRKYQPYRKSVIPKRRLPFPIWALKKDQNTPPQYEIRNFRWTDDVNCKFILTSATSVPREVVYNTGRGIIFECSKILDFTFTSSFHMSSKFMEYIQTLKKDDDESEIARKIVRYCNLVSWKRKMLAMKAAKRFMDVTLLPTTYQGLMQERNSSYSGMFPKEFYTSDVLIEDDQFWSLMK